MNSSSSDLPLLMISLLFIMLGLAVSQTNNGRAARSSVFTIVNNCNYTIWPGVLTTGTEQTFPTTGFILQSGDSTSISIPRTWTGRIWGRTLCTRDSSSGNFSCLTGDCGSSTIECSGASAIRSATLAEFTFGQTEGQDFYDVSLVMGYNLPIMISPHRVTGGDCTSVGCTKDLNAVCPRELKVVNGSDAVACDSPCDVFRDPQYCCTGEYNSPSTCKPTNYSRFFKNLCPEAYTYAFDDATSAFTCTAADYDITFCPSPSNSSNLPPSPAPTPTYECRDSNECKRSGLQPSPASTPTYTPNNNNTRGSKSNLKLTPIFMGLGVAVIVLVSAVSFIVLRFKGKSLSKLLSRGNMNDSARIEAFIAKFGSIAPNRYSYGEIKKITNQFKDKLGQGGFGSVYKGKLPEGRLIAVKVLSETKGNGEDFMNEVASISRTSHVNIVTLLGFCFEKSKRALIYEFMPKGSLDKFIYRQGPDNQSRELEWKTLYDIALGIARGLEYLHQGCNTRILHFDIKPQNILLDEYFCPKIADFGLSKLCERKESVVSMTGARGTAGYIAPEVYSRNLGGVSHKSDVYSYGMMVLEMVGGRRNIDVEVSNSSEIYYPTSIYKHLDQPTNSNDLNEEITEEDEIKKKLIAVSLCCIQINPLDRPSISKVIEMLQGSLQSLVLPPRLP